MTESRDLGVSPRGLSIRGLCTPLLVIHRERGGGERVEDVGNAAQRVPRRNASGLPKP